MKTINRQKRFFTILLQLWSIQKIENSQFTTEKMLPIHKELNINPILNFIERVWIEKTFETLVIYIEKDSVLVEILTEIELPVVLINRETTYEYREKFDSDILLLRSLSKLKENELFLEFKPFPVQTDVRTLYIFENNSQAIEIFERYCFSTLEFQIINMIAITLDFDASQTYFRCKQLDDPEVEPKQYSETSILYEDRLCDLGGKNILTLEDLLEPRTMIDTDEHGNRILSGYVGKFLQAFAEKHNANLKRVSELKPNEIISYEIIQNYTRDGWLDIGATLVIPLESQNLNELTYPLELSRYCFMVPISPDVPLNEIFTYIVRPSVFIILMSLMLIFGALFSFILHGGRISLRNVILNDRIIRGMLGQSFPQPRCSSSFYKFVLMLICFTSIMVNTMYCAYLQALLTHPPTQPPLMSVADILKAGKRVIAAREELLIFQHIPGFSLERYSYIFEKILSFNDFVKHRATLNTNYVYPVSLTRWLVFHEQQKLFSRALFFYNIDRCLLPFMLLCMPIPKASRYRHALERVILQIRDSGLMEQWLSMNFYDMVRLKRTKLDDLSTAKVYGGSLELKDLYWIWWMYLGGMCLSILWFCLELLKCRWRQYRLQKISEDQLSLQLVWLD